MFNSLRRAKQAAKQAASGSNNEAYNKLKSLVTGDAVHMRTPSKVEARATVAAAKQLKELNKISAVLSSNAPIMREHLGKDEKQLEQAIDERVERLAKEMPGKYFNKVFFDARVENQVLKEALDAHAKTLDLPLDSIVTQAKKAQASQAFYNELIRDHLRKEQATLAAEARATLDKFDEYTKSVGEIAANIKDYMPAEEYRSLTAWMFPEDLEEMSTFELFETLVYQLPPADRRQLNPQQLLDISKHKLQVLKQVKASQDAFNAKLADLSKLSAQELATRNYDDLSTHVDKKLVTNELVPALKQQLAQEQPDQQAAVDQAKKLFLQSLSNASAEYHKAMVIHSVPYEQIEALENDIAKQITFEAFTNNVNRALQMEILRQQYGILQEAEHKNQSEEVVNKLMKRSEQELTALYKEHIEPNMQQIYDTINKDKHIANVYAEATGRMSQKELGQFNLAMRLLGVWSQSALAMEHFCNTDYAAEDLKDKNNSENSSDNTFAKQVEAAQFSFADAAAKQQAAKPTQLSASATEFVEDDTERVYADPLILKVAGFTVGPRLPYQRGEGDAMKPMVKLYNEYFSKDRDAPVPDLSVDPYVSLRPGVERVIQVRQEYARNFYAIKTGRRYASFLSVNGFRPEHFVKQAYDHIVQRRNVEGFLDKINEQADYQGDLQWALMSRAAAFDRTDKLQANNFRHRTIRELEKRQSRSEKRRRLVQRLDNTLRAFAWVRNYYKSFLSK